jgi:hypothetical protein
MKPKTYRNKICKLKKEGIVEVDLKTTNTYHTLKEHKFGKAGTRNHTGVTISHNDPVYNMIKNLPMDKQSIHDVHLKFKVPNIYKIFSVTHFPKIKRSQDIVIPSWVKNNAIVKVTIHKTDTVSVIIGCSSEPIPLDYNGFIRFFNLLVRVEERLQMIVKNSSLINSNKKNGSMPDYGEWIVTMWHFGRDASIEYAGEKFSLTVEKLQGVLIRMYVKDFNGKNRIRIERQEYPKMTIFDAVNEKLVFETSRMRF